MATGYIPRYQRQVTPGGAGAPARIDPRTASVVGASIAHMGVNLSADLKEVQQRLERQDELNYLMESELAFRDGWREVLTSELTKTGKDTYGNVQRAEAWIAENSKIYLDRAPNPQVKQQLQMRLQAISHQSLDNLAFLQAKERKAVTVNNIEALGEANKRDAYLAPDQIFRLTDSSSKAVDEAVANGVLEESVGAEVKRKQNAAIHGAALEGIIDRDPVTASKVLAEFAPHLTSEQLNRYNDKIQAGLNRLQTESDKARFTQAYSDLVARFPNDEAAAMAYISDPKNYPDLDPYKRNALVSSLNAAYERKQQAIADAQKRVDRDMFEGWLERTIPDVQIINSNATPELKQKLIELNAKKTEELYKTNPQVYAQVQRKITEGKITERQQLLDYIGSGIGLDKIGELETAIKSMQDPAMSKYRQMANDLFRQRFKEDDDLLKLESDFMFLLDKHVADEGLKGPQIYKKAQELIEPFEEDRWFSWDDTTPKFQKELEAKPFVDVGPVSPGASNPNRSKAAAILRDAGAPVTENNIKEILRQMGAPE